MTQEQVDYLRLLLRTKFNSLALKRLKSIGNANDAIIVLACILYVIAGLMMMQGIFFLGYCMYLSASIWNIFYLIINLKIHKRIAQLEMEITELEEMVYENRPNN